MNTEDKLLSLDGLKSYYDNAVGHKYYYWKDITDTLVWGNATKFPKTDCFLWPNDNNYNIQNTMIPATDDSVRGTVYRVTGWNLDHGNLHNIGYSTDAVLSTCPFVFTKNFDSSDCVCICYPTSSFDYRSTAATPPNSNSFWIKKTCDCVVINQNYADKNLYIFDYSGLRTGGTSGDIKVEVLQHVPFEFYEYVPGVED